MTDEQEALALVNEVRQHTGSLACKSLDPCAISHRVALRAVQERKAFAQEVSDAVEAYNTLWHKHTPSRDTFMEMLGRFIIAKPDPLAEVMQAWWDADGYANIEVFRAALAKHNGRIVFDD